MIAWIQNNSRSITLILLALSVLFLIYFNAKVYISNKKNSTPQKIFFVFSSVLVFCFGTIIVELINGLDSLASKILYSSAIGLLVGVLLIALQPKKNKYKVSTINVQIPSISQFTFIMNDISKKVAWSLFVETITRISTQPLQNDEGYIREAMNSLYSLFQTTRDLLKTMEPSTGVNSDGSTVEMLAVSMLNKEIRPFLSKWHPKLKEYESKKQNSEADWEYQKACRKELAITRKNVLQYARGFGELADVKELDSFFEKLDD